MQRTAAIFALTSSCGTNKKSRECIYQLSQTACRYSLAAPANSPIIKMDKYNKTKQKKLPQHTTSCSEKIYAVY